MRRSTAVFLLFFACAWLAARDEDYFAAIFPDH